MSGFIYKILLGAVLITTGALAMAQEPGHVDQLVETLKAKEALVDQKIKPLEDKIKALETEQARLEYERKKTEESKAAAVSEKVVKVDMASFTELITSNDLHNCKVTAVKNVPGEFTIVNEKNEKMRFLLAADGSGKEATMKRVVNEEGLNVFEYLQPEWTSDSGFTYFAKIQSKEALNANQKEDLVRVSFKGENTDKGTDAVSFFKGLFGSAPAPGLDFTCILK